MGSFGFNQVQTLPVTSGNLAYAIPADSVARVGRDWPCTPPLPGAVKWIAGVADAGDGKPIVAIQFQETSRVEQATRTLNLVVIRESGSSVDHLPFALVVDAVGGFSSAHDPLDQSVRLGLAPESWFRLWRGPDGRLIPVLEPDAMHSALRAFGVMQGAQR
jgi:hypothetical protein